MIGWTAEGQLKRITVRAKTRNELEEKFAEAKRLHGLGLALGDITVYEWAKRWLRVNKANSTEPQRQHYKAKLEMDILPYIGGMLMREVRATHLQEMLNTYAGGKVGTVKKIKIAIKQLFEDAEYEGIIERNPAARLQLPELTETPRRPLTSFERNTMVEVAKTHQRSAYVLTMLFCGLRRGECIALTVADVDINRRRININKTMSFKTKKTYNTGKIKNPKSRAGERVVPIPDYLLPYLERLCENKKPGEALFSKDEIGAPATRQTCQGWWKSFKRQCHILTGAKLYRNKLLIDTSPFADDITPHYLRHTYATDLYAAGIDEKARKYLLGHATDDVTDIYTKMSDEAFDRAAILLNNYYASLGLIPPQPTTPNNVIWFAKKAAPRH